MNTIFMVVAGGVVLSFVVWVWRKIAAGEVAKHRVEDLETGLRISRLMMEAGNEIDEQTRRDLELLELGVNGVGGHPDLERLRRLKDEWNNRP